MAKFCMLLILLVAVCSTSASSKSAKSEDGEGLLSCLHASGLTNVTTVSSSASEFYSLLNFSAQNLRFTEPQTPRPYVIIIPESQSQLEQSVVCSIQRGWEVRVRSGGHSYEGLSYTSDVPFVLIDLLKLNKIKVDVKSKTAWVQTGATLGEVYSAIANSSPNLAFPAGVCHTVGSGGHIAGGGLSFLSRKYGLAADNVLDALLINASGKVMDKNTMGKDVFWALRGGGGGSWGVVYAWKLQLVSVPTILTAFTVLKTGADNVTEAVHRWQYVGPQMEEDIFMRVQFFGINVNNSTTIRASFHGIYLGRQTELVTKMGKIFPELGMVAAHCKEMKWIETIGNFDSINVSQMTNRYYTNKVFFKIKSDFGKKPLPKAALRGLWSIMEEEVSAYAIFSPLGGIMNMIPSTALPFPQRKGTLFDVQYKVTWTNKSEDDHYIEWMRKLHKYMKPYVSHSPRASYVNYLDLDLGSAFNGSASVEKARAWGDKYFHHNYNRLVRAKTQVDPMNYFRNSQSIPPLAN
ncbi:hypothetical protein SUGI_0715250 [Cryptomeria japonica]|uniref:berberine bridge enzyme-like D-2 n=1 Tax=Cryptomeria japonica TaxID=3369 RepID=UPI002414A627|nr:berberine bridge enzyme-like D-2 [Cryptomeria japonica]GLJ35579.1 hypothetical protein SUGI_0715250 [Cryptomeria japonica]